MVINGFRYLIVELSDYGWYTPRSKMVRHIQDKNDKKLKKQNDYKSKKKKEWKNNEKSKTKDEKRYWF